jgi:hypothetical protein
MKFTRRRNFRNPGFYIFAIIPVIFVLASFVNFDIYKLYFSITGLTLTIALIYYDFNRKIQLNDKIIIYTSPFNTYSIKIVDIKTIGIYKRSKYETKNIKPNNINESTNIVNTFIYVSTQDNFFPKRSSQNNDFIDFEYRKEAWNELSRLIANR